MLTIQKIKSILKSMVSYQTPEYIRLYFENYTWIYARSGIVECDYHKLTWAVPYIPYSFYDVSSDNKHDEIKFRELLLTLRQRILQFVDDYLDVSKYNPDERQQLKDARKQRFIEYMRSPYYQGKFAAGVPRELIEKEIYQNHYPEINNSSLISPHEIFQVVKSKRARSKQILKARFEKFKPEAGPGVQEEKMSFWKVFWIAEGVLILFYLIVQFFEYCYNYYNTNYIVIRARFIHYWGYVERAEEYFNSFDRWCKIITFREKPTPEEKLFLVDFKAALHTLYDVYNGNKVQAASHASYLLVTRPEAITDLINMVHTPLQMNREFQAEAGTDIIASIMALFKLNNIERSEIDKHARYLHAFNLTKGSFKGYIEFAQEILSIISMAVFGVDPFNEKFNIYVRDIFAMIDSADTFQVANITTLSKRAEIFKLSELRKKMIDARLDPFCDRLPKNLHNLFITRANQVDNVAAASLGLLNGTYSRVEPVCVLFTGPPSVGKTACTQYASEVLTYLSSNGKEIYSEEMTYHYNSFDKFWQGYAQNKFCRIDDVFSLTDMQDRSLEAGNIINMVNTSAMNLNMASMAEKGNVFFNSEYLFLSTNIANNGIQHVNWQVGLTSPDALLRRFHLVLHKDTPFDKVNLGNNMYRIDKCPYEELIGTEISYFEVPKLIYRMRIAHEQSGMNKRMTKEELDQLYGDEIRTEASYSAVNLYASYLARNLYDWAKEVNVADYIKTFFYVVLAISTVSAIGTFFLGTVENFQTESAEKKIRRRPLKNKHGKNVSRFKPRRFTTESDDNYFQSLCSIKSGVLQLNVKHFRADGTMLGSQSSVAFHLKDGIIILPRHSLINKATLEKSAYIHFDVYKGDLDAPASTGFLGTIIGKATDKDVSVHETEDIASIKVTFSQIPKALYDYLPSGGDYPDLPIGHEMQLIQGHRFGNKIRTLRFADSSDVEYDVQNVHFIVEHTLGYYEPSSEGDSGSPIFIAGEQGRPILIGMHIGRSGTKGISAQVCSEYLDCFMEIQTESGDFPFVITETVDPIMGAFNPNISKIKKSALYGCFGPPTFIPARLRPFETVDGTVDPEKIALSKLHQEFTPKTYIPVEDIVDSLLTWYPPQTNYWRNLLTYDEALNGTSYGILSISASTSAGYPWCLTTTKGKAPYIRFVGTYIYDEEFLEYVKRCEQDLRNGNQISVIYKDVLKDELRPIEKVLKGKTRLFVCGPLHYYILCRIYFGGIMAFTQSLCDRCPISIGIDAHGLAWTEIAMQMSKCKSLLSGDFSNFDGKLPKFVGEVALEFINKWYNDEYSNVRTLLFEHMWNPMHINGCNKYQTCDGTPSGALLTGFYNSLCQIIMILTVCYEEYRIPFESIALRVYGDDGLIGLPIPGMRCSHFAPHFKRRFDMEYTHWTKAENEEIDTIWTVRYLGRSFVRVQSFVLAPLEIRVVLEMLYWIKSAENHDDTISSTVESFLIEATHFGRERWLELREQLQLILQNRLPDLVLHNRVFDKTYAVYMQRYWGKIISFRSESAFWPKANVVTYPEVKETQNLEMVGRGANEAPPTEQFELGTAHDVAPVDLTNINSETHQTAYVSPNLEEFDLDRVLRREYPVAKFTWTSAQAQDTTLGALQFPDVMLIQPFIADKIKNFRYIRTGFRLSIRMVANDFSYGMVMMKYSPILRMNPEAQVGTGNFYSTLLGSGYPHILMRADESGVMVYDIPFVYDKRFLDLTDYVHGDLGIVSFSVVNPFTNIINEVSSADIFVTAQFLEPQLLLPFSSQSGDFNNFPPLPLEQFRPRIVPKGTKTRPPTKEEKDKLIKTAIVFPPETFSKPPFKSESGNWRDMNGDRYVKVKDKDGYDFVPLEEYKRQHQVPKEAIKKSSQGIISSTLEKASDIAGVLSHVPVVGTYADIFKTVAKPASSFLKMAGLNKPSTLAMTDVGKINPFADLNYGKGMDLAPKLAMDPSNGISTQPIVGGVSHDEMDLHYIAGTPMMIGTYGIGPTTTPGLLVPLSTDRNCYCDWITRTFRFWSGSFKYRIYVVASKRHSVRFVLYFASSLTTEWQNCYHQIHDIQGSTTIEFSLPYASPEIMQQNTDDIGLSLNIAILSWSQPDDTISAPVYLNIYKAADSDFEWGCLQDIYYTSSATSGPTPSPYNGRFEYIKESFIPQSNPREDFSMAFNPFHPTMKGYGHEGIVNGERYSTIREMLHRNQAYRDISSDYPQPVYGVTGATPASYFGIEALAQLYMFWRGSIRIKLISAVNTSNVAYPVGFLPTTLVVDDPQGNAIFGTSISSMTNPIVETEVPYYEQYLFKSARTDPGYYTYKYTPFTAATSGQASCFLFKSAGDDFSFHFLVPFPSNGRLTKPPPYTPETYYPGFNGFYQFMKNR